MRCLKNSVKVAPVSNPRYQRSADKYGCDECCQEGLTGFSKPFTSQATPDVLIKEKKVKRG